MIEQTRRQAREANTGGGTSSSPPRPATRVPPPSTAPKPPPSPAASTIAAPSPHVPSTFRAGGGTRAPRPVGASVPPPLPAPTVSIGSIAPSSEPLTFAERPKAPVRSAPPEPGDSREELRRLLGHANEALAFLQRVIREMEQHLVSLDAGPSASHPAAPATSAAPKSTAGAMAVALRRLAWKLAAWMGRVVRVVPSIRRLHERSVTGAAEGSEQASVMRRQS